MAKSSQYYFMLLAFLFIPTLAISSSEKHHHNYHHQKPKSMHFTLYQHDIFNKTDFIIVAGVSGTNISQTTTPFGTISVLNDPITATPDPLSKVVGKVDATVITSGFDGGPNSLSIASFALKLEDGHSGTISVLGLVNTLKASDVPITGGTGDFLMVQGYLSTTLVSLEGLTFKYKLDFHLYWPHYAPHRAIHG